MSRVLLVGLIGSTLALGTGVETSALLLVVALALVALAAVASTGTFALTPVPVRVDVRRTPPVLATRATDPVHHPLRPRAPGSCC